jgi:hypothetical protein
MVKEQWTNAGTRDGVMNRKSITNATRKSIGGWVRPTLRTGDPFYPIVSEMSVRLT